MDNPSSLLVVQDLAISKEFYMNVLGFNMVEEFQDSFKLKLGSHHVYMFEGTMEAIGNEHGYNASSTMVISICDLDEKIKELKSKKCCIYP